MKGSSSLEKYIYVNFCQGRDIQDRSRKIVISPALNEKLRKDVTENMDDGKMHRGLIGPLPCIAQPDLINYVATGKLVM